MTTITYDIEPGVIGDDRDWRHELTVDLEGGRVHVRNRSRHSSENGIPMSVWHGVVQQWRAILPAGRLDAEAVKSFVEDLADDLATVAAGHSVEWDGSNYVGRLTDAAHDASERIADAMDSDLAYMVRDCWHAADWIAPALDETVDECHGMTDAEIGAHLVACADADGFDLHNVDDAVAMIRSEIDTTTAAP